ncbi:class I SAM-dependent methyltransferase [Salisediminibacterium halotolerans]|uniref:Methyltransferase domain-containing protein n=1 Tax=Salisediminibacterium halotolerans TaxID=517425 RepID=A0A1H9UIL9_9BACI|nr:methyltransferase domain-containing protein [Salisediminibacterium haloalkalitolerans]SES08893.1 Methyltransferase domain-containing protein [Salisediminibacterium haloalkalitolerans]
MAGHRFDPAKAEKLLDPERTKKIDPESIADRLNISPDMNVLDLGAGNGFFTFPLAARTSGDIYAVDVEPEMLGLLSVRAQTAGYNHIGYIEADLEEIPLADNCAGAAVAAFVVHEISNRVNAYEELKRMLIPGGRAAITDWAPVESDSGPPLYERIERDTIIAELESAGFSLIDTLEHEEAYTIIVETPE